MKKILRDPRGGREGNIRTGPGFEPNRSGRIQAHCPLLGERFQQVDLAALPCYCEAVARRETAQKQLLELGKKNGTGIELLIDTPSGYQQKHPLLTVIDKCDEQIRHWAAEFGFSPRVRKQVWKEDERQAEDAPGDTLEGGKVLSFTQSAKL